MRENKSIPSVVVIPVLGYPDLGAAVRWLCDTFGFSERLRIADHRVQLNVPQGGAVVATQKNDRDAAVGAAHSIMVRVDDVDAHHARSVRAGARVVRGPETFAFGERQYSVVDVGGHAWTFTQSVDDVAPETWGGQLVEVSR